MGPLISPQAKSRVEELIQSAVDEGAEVRYNIIKNSDYCYYWLLQVLLKVCETSKNLHDYL